MSEGNKSVVLNPAKQLMDAGKLSLMFSVRQTRSVDIALVAKAAGYDSIYIDLEHGALTVPEAGQICVTALAVGLSPFVRVPAGATDAAGQVLDLGAMGIIAPHISGPADAERMVAACKYPPVGKRSNSSSLPQQWLAKLPLVEVQERLNKETMVLAMIESRDGLENVEAIAAVPGVDVLLVGTSDLSAELGIPGQFGSDIIMKALDRIIAAAKKHGKHVSLGGGIKGGSVSVLKTLCDKGIRQISVGNDVGMLNAAMRQRVIEINKLIS